MSWSDTLREELGEEPEPVLAAYENVKELRAKWLRGAAWNDRNPEHPEWEANWEKTAQRARDFAAAADALAEWVGCGPADLRELLEHEEAEAKERERVAARAAELAARGVAA